MKEALFYKKLEDNGVHCQLCPQGCRLAAGETGKCNARQNLGGKLVSLNYGELTSIAIDPIEKKPFYHFYPGTYILSVGTFGCNFSCLFCQNADISQGRPPTTTVSPQELVQIAKDKGSYGISYTYNEPMIWLEYVRETAELAHSEGLKNVLVTNGFINPKPLEALLPYIDAANVDLKCIRDEFYVALCDGHLAPVLATCKAYRAADVHLEVTNLIIPTKNDSDADLTGLRDWIADNLGEETPAHLSAYFPHHKLHIHPTPAATIHKAVKIFRQRLPYTYPGNLFAPESNKTVCPACGSDIIVRSGYGIDTSGLAGTKCKNCGQQIPVIN